MTTTTAPTFTREEAKAHDAITFDLLKKQNRAERDADLALHYIHEEAGDRKVNVSTIRYRADYRWKMTDAEAIDKVQGIVADPKSKYDREVDGDDAYWAYISRNAQEKLDKYNGAFDQIRELQAAIKAQEAVFAAQGWSRFEVVPGGHVHDRNITCHTLRPTTRVAWVPGLSGDSEADAVQAYGPALCSKCFKSAPVEWQQKAKVAKTTDASGEIQPLTIAEAQAIADEKAAAKAEREAKRAAREAKRAARG